MIRRLVGSASSSIPCPFLVGMSFRSMKAVAALAITQQFAAACGGLPGRPTTPRVCPRSFRLSRTITKTGTSAVGAERGRSGALYIIPLGRNYLRIDAERGVAAPRIQATATAD